VKLNCREIGALGEKIAARYLVDRNYQVINLNYRKIIGEIDIIALDQNGDLVFFEVKARSNQSFGAPQEAVDKDKQFKLVQLASNYLQDNQVFARRNFRIDVISVALDFSNRKAKIEHLKNAVEGVE